MILSPSLALIYSCCQHTQGFVVPCHSLPLYTLSWPLGLFCLLFAVIWFLLLNPASNNNKVHLKSDNRNMNAIKKCLKKVKS